MPPRSSHGGWALAISVAVLGCGGGEPSSPPADGSIPYDGPPIPWAYAPFPSVLDPVDNPTSPAKVELGRLLFYDPILSRDRKVACATCHSEIWGMGDGLGVSVGVDGVGPTGPGRDGPNKTRRNAMTLWNVALREALFWDGRSGPLEDQALAPIDNELELDKDVGELLTELGEIEAYRELFAAAFPESPAASGTIREVDLARALAAFQRTMISSLSPYDRYVGGDAGALTGDVLDGMYLFAEAGCAACHVPPRFESEVYADRGAPSPDHDDEGRFEVTGADADRGHFRVPTLRNLRETGPYFHAGTALSLAEAVAHEVEIAVLRGESRALDDAEVDRIAEFLRKALMDRSKEPDRPEAVPSGLAVPEDGFQIPR